MKAKGGFHTDIHVYEGRKRWEHVSTHCQRRMSYPPFLPQHTQYRPPAAFLAAAVQLIPHQLPAYSPSDLATLITGKGKVCVCITLITDKG